MQLATSLSVLPEDAGWYLFHRHDCHGPFTRTQVVTLISKRRIDASWMIMRDGWSEWRSLVDCIGELASGKPEAKVKDGPKPGAPRAALHAAIDVANKYARTNGQARNISVSGIFVNTPETPFRMGEVVSLHVNAVELKTPFDVKAEVVRYNANRKFDAGYGLRFVDLENNVVVDIARLIGYRPTQAFGEMVNSFPFNRPLKQSKKGWA